MHSKDQSIRRNGAGLPAGALAQAGFALAALLVAIAVLSIVMLVALPTWRHQVQREKEIELIFRGEQYARAIGLYQRKLPGTFPPNIDTLVEQKFLRRKYKDPITGEDFVPIYANSPEGREAMQQAIRQAVQTSGGSVRMQTETGPDGRRTVTMTLSGSVTVQTPQGRGSIQGPGTVTIQGASSGIVGVMSKSKAQSIRLYNGRDRHDLWFFTSVTAAVQGGQRGGAIQRPAQGPPRPPGTPPPPPPGRGRGRGGQ